jgi:hypothetical protein
MEKQEFELFVHVQGDKPKVVVVVPGDILRDVLARIGALGGGRDDMLVFVGESDDALKGPDDVEDGDDDHTPVDVGLTLEALGLRLRRHVHCHRCRRIAGEVNFGGKTIRRKFSPATTIGVVTEWARRKFRLDAAAAAEYVLQLVGTAEQPRSDVHLGELVTEPKCSLGFDLVKEVTPQG